MVRNLINRADDLINRLDELLNRPHDLLNRATDLINRTTKNRLHERPLNLSDSNDHFASRTASS